MDLVLEPTTQICPRFSWEKMEISRVGLLGVRRIGASESPVRGRCWSTIAEGSRCGYLLRATKLSLSHILPQTQQSGATENQVSGAPAPKG